MEDIAIIGEKNVVGHPMKKKHPNLFPDLKPIF
jgi:hypothetical protein